MLVVLPQFHLDFTTVGRFATWSVADVCSHAFILLATKICFPFWLPFEILKGEDRVMFIEPDL